jgi:hypothetical protein
MPVGKFKDVGKSAKDLLKDNFDVTGDNSLKVVNKTANGVTFTTEGTVGKKWSSAVKFSPYEGVTVKKFKADTVGRFFGEATVDDAFMTGLQLSLNVEDGAGSSKQKAVVGLNYGTDDFHLAADADVADIVATVLNAAVNVNVPVDGLTVGASAAFNTTTSGVDSYATRFNYTTSDMTLAAESGAGLGNTNVSVFHKYDADTNIAATVSMNRGVGNIIGTAAGDGDAKTKMAIGVTNKLDGDATIGAKIDSGNQLGLFYTQRMNSALTLTTAAQIDVGKWTQNDGHSAGFKLTYG